MKLILLNIILVLSIPLFAQHTVNLRTVDYMVTDTFTVNSTEFFFMEYGGSPYLCIHAPHTINKFIGVVGDASNGTKYRAVVRVFRKSGWVVLSISSKDVESLPYTNQLTVFTDRGPLILALTLQEQFAIREQANKIFIKK